MGFAALVASYTRWLGSTEALAAGGLLVKGRDGLVIKPLLRVCRQAQSEYTRMLSEFGFTPSSSSRVHAVRPEAEDPFESYMRQRGN